MTVQCVSCRERVDVPATDEQIARWKAGELIQRAMPNLTAAQRELLISGTCDDCWQKMFSESEWTEEDKALYGSAS